MSENVRLKVLTYLVEIQRKIGRNSCNEFLDFLATNYDRKLLGLNNKSCAIISEDCGYPVNDVLTRKYEEGDNNDVALCVSLIPELLRVFNDFISIWDIEKIVAPKVESSVVHFDMPEIPEVEILSDKEALKAWGLAPEEDETEEDASTSSSTTSTTGSSSAPTMSPSSTGPVTHVNVDKKYLPKPGRKGEFLSETDFLDKISKVQGSPVSNLGEIDLYALMEGSSKLSKDLEKVSFDMENIDCEGTVFGTLEMCGYHAIDNKFSYIGVYAGGDWEEPLMFIIYHDGYELRGYIPTCGNSFNAEMKTAFGSEGENKLSASQLDKLVKKYGYASVDDMFESEDISEKYCLAQGADFTTVQPSLEHVIEDIKARFSL